MALLTDKQTEKNLSERLTEFIQFGMVLNYMLEIEKIDVADLEKMFFDSDQEKATFLYSKVLKKIDARDIENSYSIYSHKYPNELGLPPEEYHRYLNSHCLKKMLSFIAGRESRLDKTYVNTYHYLLSEEEIR